MRWRPGQVSFTPLGRGLSFAFVDAALRRGILFSYRSARGQSSRF